MDGELEQRLEDVPVAVQAARRDGVDPRAERRLVVPRQAVPAEHAEVVADDAHRPVRMALHDRRAHRLGEDHEVALGARRPVEHRPLVVAVEASDQPAGQPVGEQP